MRHCPMFVANSDHGGRKAWDLRLRSLGLRLFTLVYGYLLRITLEPGHS
jgi:hypothetical protein